MGAGVARTAADKRDAEILTRYHAGESMAAIGMSYGLTRQRVQQIVARRGGGRPRRARELDPEVLERRRAEREQLRQRFHDLVGRRPPMTLQEAADRLGLRDTDLAQRLRPGDRRLLLPPERVREQRYTDDQLIQAVQKVARTLKVSRLTRQAYDTAREERPGLPSSARITQRFDTWSEVCRRAGLEVRTGRSGPAPRWTREQMLAAVVDYLRDPGTAGTSWEYEVWRVGRDAPGYPTLRQEFGSWHALKAEALAAMSRKSRRRATGSRR